MDTTLSLIVCSASSKILKVLSLSFRIDAVSCNIIEFFLTRIYSEDLLTRPFDEFMTWVKLAHFNDRDVCLETDLIIGTALGYLVCFLLFFYLLKIYCLKIFFCVPFRTNHTQ